MSIGVNFFGTNLVIRFGITEYTKYRDQKERDLLRVIPVHSAKRAQNEQNQEISRKTILLIGKPNIIGHFRVVFCLCFKTSPSAKPFI